MSSVQVYSLGLQPPPEKVVSPPKPTPPFCQEVVGALGIMKFAVPSRSLDEHDFTCGSWGHGTRKPTGHSWEVKLHGELGLQALTHPRSFSYGLLPLSLAWPTTKSTDEVKWS